MALEQSRHIDVEMFDDSASEVSYASNQRAPPYQMQYRPFAGPMNSPLRHHPEDPEEPGRARPGRPPARADSELTQEELKRRNRRRQRNREAAQRCRQRRLDQIDVLKDEVDKLKKEAADTNQMNSHLKSELRKLRFQLDLYEKNVGPLSQLTAQQQYARPHPMLVSQPIKIEQTPQMTSALETQATQSIAPLAPQAQLPPQEPVPAAVPASSSATPPSVSTNTSPSVPAALQPIISPYPGGLMPLISPVNGMFFALTPTQGMITPSIITPTLKHGEFFFPDLEKARNESVTELSKIAQKITANQPGTSAVEDVSSIDDETAKARENKEEQPTSDKETN